MNTQCPKGCYDPMIGYRKSRLISPPPITPPPVLPLLAHLPYKKSISTVISPLDVSPLLAIDINFEFLRRFFLKSDLLNFTFKIFSSAPAGFETLF